MVEVEEVELDLALSIGGSFSRHTIHTPPPPDSKPDSFTRLVGDPHDKRVIQALRRMEAKKKREQKRERVRETEPEWEQVSKKEKTECDKTVTAFGPWRTTEPFRVHQFATVQYLPLNTGFPLPCWVGSQKNAGGVDGGKGCDNKTEKSNCSSKCSSSADYQSSSREDGGSSDSHSHSVHSLAEQPHLTTSKETSIGTQPEESASASSHPMKAKQGNKTEERKHIAKEAQPKPNPSSPEPMKIKQEAPTSHDAVLTMAVENKSLSNENSAPLMEAKGELGKPPKPLSHTSLLPQMPYVSTKGNNGKTVHGFLYRYNKSEVSIVCVCHGSTFSPAEFVQHAGGTDITHPLRHITVIPSALG
ncbi:ninja-family protein 5-like [Vigna umbellata]|uniref:ninja-family protein 5-like n=1 Tax=Vigna umbellata TaxID=87088 RepID=UPI001F5E734E|nr:ninja-family protein 5-like [Vigna umbellata]XP_047158581.1 ninja-family protein 5-like [Vigna umbellata]